MLEARPEIHHHSAIPATGLDGPTWPTDPVARLEMCLARVRSDDPRIGAMNDIDEAGALRAAAQSAARWQRCAARSIIDGMIIAVKANIAVAGLPHTAGIRAYADVIASEDAPCVAALRAAGAVILGTTNMEEGALGGLTDNPWFGRTHHPRRPGWTAGGSSGGSAAAIEAGFCEAALGTDTIGSVRIPASYCGTFGHKPQRSLLSLGGIVPLSPSFDQVGVMARSALDCRLVIAHAAGARIAPAADQPLAGRSVAALDWADDVDVDAETTAAYATTLDTARRGGASVTPVRLAAGTLSRLQHLLFVVAEIEGAAVHTRMITEQPDGFSPGFLRMLRWGASQPADRLSATLAEIAGIAREARQLLAPYDALLSPTTPQTSFAFDAATPGNQAAFTALASSMGLPATAFPAGVTAERLPLSAQVMARDDSECLAFAGALAVKAA